jgi:hypothetical protein
MATTLINYGSAVPLVTTQLLAARVSLCNPLNAGENPSTIPITIAWSNYKNALGTAAPIAPILINLQTGVSNPISGVRSIKIDNIGCISPCTVYFPDTGDEVICGPDSSVMSNVLTGQLQCIVSMTPQTGNIGTATRLFFNNFQLAPAEISDEKAVENFELATGSPFSINFTRARAVGDKWQYVNTNLANIGVPSQQSLFGGPPNGYNAIVVQECRVSTIGNYTDGIAPVFMSVSIVDELANVYQTFEWYATNDLDNYNYRRIYDMNVAQFYLGGSVGGGVNHKYFLQNNVAGNGNVFIELVYTLVNIVNLP